MRLHRVDAGPANIGELARPVGKMLVDARLGEGWLVVFRWVRFGPAYFRPTTAGRSAVQPDALALRRHQLTDAALGAEANLGGVGHRSNC